MASVPFSIEPIMVKLEGGGATLAPFSWPHWLTWSQKGGQPAGVPRREEAAAAAAAAAAVAATVVAVAAAVAAAAVARKRKTTCPWWQPQGARHE